MHLIQQLPSDWMGLLSLATLATAIGIIIYLIVNVLRRICTRKRADRFFRNMTMTT